MWQGSFSKRNGLIFRYLQAPEWMVLMVAFAQLPISFMMAMVVASFLMHVTYMNGITMLNVISMTTIKHHIKRYS